MRRLSTIFVYICLNIYLTACGSSGGGAAPESAPAVIAPPSLVSPPSGGGSLSGQYYSYAVTETISRPAGPAYPITITGRCVVYNSLDYCWDDGWHVVAALGDEDDFWGLCKIGTVVSACSGGGSTDPVASKPTLWTQMLAHSGTPRFWPSDVYTHGTVTHVTCTLSGAIVDCGDFQIDTAQAPL